MIGNFNWRDLAVRALHTFWQAFTAALAVTWAASGIDISQVTDVDAAKKALLALVGALVAAALSAAKSTAAQLLARRQTPAPPSKAT